MADQHPNDDYINPASRTAAAPIPPETPHDGTGDQRAEDPEAGKDADADATQAAKEADARSRSAKK